MNVLLKNKLRKPIWYMWKWMFVQADVPIQRCWNIPVWSKVVDQLIGLQSCWQRGWNNWKSFKLHLLSWNKLVMHFFHRNVSLSLFFSLNIKFTRFRKLLFSVTLSGLFILIHADIVTASLCGAVSARTTLEWELRTDTLAQHARVCFDTCR